MDRMVDKKTKWKKLSWIIEFQTDRRRERHRHTNRQTERRTNRQKDGLTERQTDKNRQKKQIDRRQKTDRRILLNCVNTINSAD